MLWLVFLLLIITPQIGRYYIISQTAATYYESMEVIDADDYRALTAAGETIIPASDYIIGDEEFIDGTSWVVRAEKRDGIKYLYVYTVNIEADYVSQMTFEVYGDSDDARQALKNHMDFYSQYADLEETGDGYFIGYTPNVIDCSIKEFMYLKDNVIINANIEYSGEYMTSDGEVDHFTNDMSYMIDYILDNQDYIIDKLYTNILCD